ncbi:hypothetical protein Spith_1320 [Spirochaeta thermophila DSM 6578]|uniref:Glycoside hydrolase family 65 n=1 Tax=Winmispira thermophila (strain ATCC 700085 / DSM 6578 / Z-1203) TaxID=869211 RepID=G0GFH1_WINT7|nr:hypothetical protein [Spirochaeta thermophila]AEJ61585.1 hypothetical protein Spith_1320 [Spirochaeta thermophila DSM 6578]
MAIRRKDVVRRHNPVLYRPDPLSPLTVGNGEFAFTADITGLQTFPVPKGGIPLCTMAQWAFHSYPDHPHEDLRLTYHRSGSRTVGYMSEATGQEDVYTALRINPHRFHLGTLGFLFGKGLRAGSMGEDGCSLLRSPRQELDLWTGSLHSFFLLEGSPVEVFTVVHPSRDLVAVRVEAPRLLERRKIALRLAFPYPSHEMEGAHWDSEDRHRTEVVRSGAGNALLLRHVDETVYFVHLRWKGGGRLFRMRPHLYVLEGESSPLEMSVEFTPVPPRTPCPGWTECAEGASAFWEEFWTTGGMIDFSRSTHPGAQELERRVVLSRYLTTVQCAGSLPPQETGLTCNSWYGKFHLEMHLLHAGHFVLWGHPNLLERSLWWYRRILPEAVAHAASQGYEGARWPKMTDPSGKESPSPIGVYLCWQQPHPIMYAELLRRAFPSRPVVDEYAEIVFQTARFMVDFLQWDGRHYNLGPPLIPVQETHHPLETLNPVFELAYWRWALETAREWMRMSGGETPPEWERVLSLLAPLPVSGGIFPAHERCSTTWTEHNRDHPSMLFPLALLPDPPLDREVVRRTLGMVLSSWDFPSMWGWDFPLLALVAARVGEVERVPDLLLMESPKNTYLPNGHNYQGPDLPVYLPGNGALLWAVALMSGKDGAGETRGFPSSKGWMLEVEHLPGVPFIREF